MSQAEPLLGKQDLKVSVKRQAHDIRGVTLSLTLRTLFLLALFWSRVCSTVLVTA